MKTVITKNTPRIFFIFLFFIPSVLMSASGQNTKQLLDSLDRILEQRDHFVKIREARISAHKKLLKKSGLTDQQIFDMNNQLALDYKSYNCDSILSYYGKNMALATKNNDTENLFSTKLNLYGVLRISGMNKEAFDILESIDPADISNKNDLRDYYWACYSAYSAIRPQYHELKVKYDNLAVHYRELYLSIADPDCDNTLFLNELKMQEEKKFDKALKINDLRLKKTTIKDPTYALVLYHRSKIYQKLEDTENYKKTLILSVIQDVRKATKDNASLRLLANQCFKEGDIDRADRYIQISLEDAQFYNAKLRSIYLSQSLPIINQAYKNKHIKQLNILKIMVVAITFLLLLLAGITLSIIRHKKVLEKSRNDLQKSNEQLNLTTQNLNQANQQLQKVNDDLIESNYIKENYIARFLSMSSSYLSRIEKLSRIIRKKSHTDKNPLPKDLSEALTDNEMNEFYDIFDDSFLTIYPTFIDEFNKLMKEEEKIVIETLPNKKVLNTELRVFALIRLGFEDSSSIARMLRYSVNTIYNVRSQVKNKANVPRQDFESYVKKIGSY